VNLMTENKILWCEKCKDVKLNMDICDKCNNKLEKIGWLEDNG